MSQEIPVVYPTPQLDPPATSHHSNGSFGSVFIVLAIIVVISAIACFLGRLCSKRSHKAHDKQSKDHRGKEGKKQQKQAFPKKEWEPKHNQTRDAGDIEFGFDSKRVQSAKVAANNGDHSAMGPSKSFRNGEFKGFPGGDHAAMGAGSMRFPGGDHAAMGAGPMRFPGGDHAAAMGPSRSFRNGGEMRFPEGGGEHRAGPVPYN